MLTTVADNLEETANEIQSLLAELLLKHSEIYQWNRHDPDSNIFIFSEYGNYKYRTLSEDGRRLQARLLEGYRRFNAILNSLLREQPQDTMQVLRESDTLIQRTVEQQETSCETTQEALQKATEALQSQVGLMKRLYDALLYNPKLESWSFTESPKFTLVLLPTVLSELDSHKVNYRHEGVRDKADKLIRQIKEYRRRGKLVEGVPIVTDAITLVAFATEPRKESFLPWLDPDNNDDRLLAASLEVMRIRPRSPVILVSRDINLQNRAEFARIPFVEPPEPV